MHLLIKQKSDKLNEKYTKNNDTRFNNWTIISGDFMKFII